MLNLLFRARGRIGRGSWWLAQFIAIPVVLLLGFVSFAGTIGLEEADVTSDLSGAVGLLVIALAIIASTWINVATTIKRFHDRGKSGLWFLIVFVPFIGATWQLIECGFCTGDDGDNQYGPPPGSAAAHEALNREISGMAASSGKLAKLDDEYFKNYAAAQAATQAATQATRASEPTVQSSYARPAATISPGSARTAFGKR